MLEAGAKIYVCRVEKTKSEVMDLASTLNLQQRKKKERDEGAADDNEGQNPDEPNDVDDQENEANATKKKQRNVKVRDLVSFCYLPTTDFKKFLSPFFNNHVFIIYRNSKNTGLFQKTAKFRWLLKLTVVKGALGELH